MVPHVLCSPTAGTTFQLLPGERGAESYTTCARLSNSRRAAAQRWKPNRPCLREAGQRRVRGVSRRSEFHSPLRQQPQTRLGETRVKWASVKTNRASREDRGTPPKNLRGADPRNGGRRPSTRRAPTQGLAFRCLTRYILDTGRLLAQLEVDVERAGARLLRWYFLTLTPAVTSLLFLSGGVPVLVAESMVSFTVVMFGMCLLRDWS